MRQQAEFAELVGEFGLQVIHSQRGHDSFLVESDQVNAVLFGALT